MRCTACGHRYSLLKGEPESYSAEYFLEAHRNWFNNPNTPLFQKVTDGLRELPAGARVLDVGCGKGDFLKYLHGQRPDLELCGLDLSPNQDVPGITFVQSLVEEYEPTEPYDALVTMAVIEHIDDIQGFAQKLSDLVKPNGLVVVMTLDDTSLLYKLGRLFRKFGINIIYNRIYQAHHLNHFNRVSLQTLLERADMELVEYHGHNVPLAAIDIPATGLLQKVLRAGVWGVFNLSELTGNTYLQTLFMRSKR
ncbi:class I SAM-dependent methyltransferase [Actomonas aquatica]|uniref:Class I SAM-dependent methyltransferase n=1 Tax=Actomonas aquatica TaxID=2866162 RepID=A0ABZ1CA69_9BACT|nr:class I SAM-dependent methyltransferase [Opitutus sp. WL0086]WRQ88489.1 class I SAM-dependent methyltransferase [Opitutus sp. WL0086]